MKIMLAFLLTIGLSFPLLSSAQTKPAKYKATIKSFSIGTVEGFIYVSLFDENKDKLRIDVTRVIERSGFFATEPGTLEVSTVSITEFMIDSSTYKFWNMHNGSRLLNHFCVKVIDVKALKFYASASDTSVFTLQDLYTSGYEQIENCMTTKKYGVDSFGIYQVGLTWNPDVAAVILPTKISLGRSFIYNTSFTTNTRWKDIVFKACPGIKKSIDDGTEDWVLKQEMSNAEKVEVWKKYIDAWMECQRTKDDP